MMIIGAVYAIVPEILEAMNVKDKNRQNVASATKNKAIDKLSKWAVFFDLVS